ncbi:hypothetical protein [Paenibacillus tianjinensis]|uniref:Uncharacterized protein n=1 Tax=Paenibacillus tianjinensis TaxID=2810347 RepID=A0ABX7L7J3_9BACL|nr:hypothetical protein [Paenibacillus tianjinensis]QSF43301.1 hypothetical protein JRJ22_18715 [Paenibacillus tianjinensis]
MDNKTDIIGVFIQEDYGNDYFDRYLCPADIYVYIFECGKQRYIWQSKQRCELGLIEGSTYHMKAIAGRRLLGGRGLSISEVEVIGEMNINNKVIRLTEE